MPRTSPKTARGVDCTDAKKQAGRKRTPLRFRPSDGRDHHHKQIGLVSSGCGSNHCTWTESVLQGLLQGSVKRRVTALTGADPVDTAILSIAGV